MLTKLLIGLLGAGVIATGGYAAASGLGDTAPARTVSLPGATTATTTGTTTAGTTTTVDTTTAVATTDDIVVGNAPAIVGARTTGEAISGPCDEAEHANDTRCTGGTGAADGDGNDDDRSGSNRGSDDDGNDDEDRSGSNSGSGSDSDDDNDD